MECSSSGVKMCSCWILGTLGFFMNFGFSSNPEWDMLPWVWSETITLFVPEWTDGVHSGDLTLNRTALGVFWETPIDCLVHFWLWGVESFNFFLKKRSSKFFWLCSTISSWVYFNIDDGILCLISVCTLHGVCSVSWLFGRSWTFDVHQVFGVHGLCCYNPNFSYI